MVPLQHWSKAVLSEPPRHSLGAKLEIAFSLPVQSSTMSKTRYERQSLYMASSREIQHKDQPKIPLPWWSKVYDPVELVAGPCRLDGASRRGKKSHTVTLAFGIVWYVFAMFAHVTQVSERLNWGWVNTSDTIFGCSNSLWAIFCPSSGFLTRPKWQVLTRLDSSVLSMARARFSACQSRGTWTSSGLQAGTWWQNMAGAGYPTHFQKVCSTWPGIRGPQRLSTVYAHAVIPFWPASSFIFCLKFTLSRPNHQTFRARGTKGLPWKLRP